MEAWHRSQEVRASCRLQVAADLAAWTTICSLQSTPVRDDCDMTDCSPANKIKGAAAGQAAKQLIYAKLFKHKTVQKV